MEIAIKDGKIDGANISFSITLDFGGMPFMLSYKGVVDERSDQTNRRRRRNAFRAGGQKDLTNQTGLLKNTPLSSESRGGY